MYTHNMLENEQNLRRGEGNKTSHTNMMRDSWIYNKLVVAHRHDIVKRLCLHSSCRRNMLVGATATKQPYHMFTHNYAMTRAEFTKKKRKRANFMGN